MKKILILILLLSLLPLSSCADPAVNIIDGVIDDLPVLLSSGTEAEKTEISGFKNLYSSFKSNNDKYFSKAETSVNTFINQKYTYVITSYKHSDGIYDILGMFFDKDSEYNLGVYFLLLGYGDREYTETDNTAFFRCEKDGDLYEYVADYDTENKVMNITSYKGGALLEDLKCTLKDGSIEKTYYNHTVNRLFVSSSDSMGNVNIRWYDFEYEDGEPYADTESTPDGYIYFDGVSFTGEIN